MITSKQNRHIKSLQKLHKKRTRDESGLFLIEGESEIANFGSIEKLYFSCRSAFVDECESGGSECIQVQREILDAFVYRSGEPIAVAKKRSVTLQELDSCTRLLVVEAIEKPGNFGAILRTAAAAGVEGVLVCDAKTDLYHPNVVRNSKGVLGAMPIIEISTKEAIEYLLARGLPIIAASPAGKTPYYEIDYSKGFCLAVGSEDKGLSRAWSQGEIEQVMIPMQGHIDSLNVSVSAAVILYEALRQRYYAKK